MIKIAILGHGVVGTGTARMIEDNAKCIETLVGDAVEVKYILDIRDLPDSPWADRIVHDFSVIAERIPSTYMFLSAGFADERGAYAGHNPHVRFNEDVCPIGVAAYVHCAMRWLESHSAE